MAEYERQKFNVLGTFSDFRERVAERERRLEAEYSSRIIDLSEEVLGAKKDFEERMKSFQLLQANFWKKTWIIVVLATIRTGERTSAGEVEARSST